MDVEKAPPRGEHGVAALRMEAAGLAWLAEAEPAGGTRIARARLDGELLRVARVEPAAASPQRAEALGRSLALLHAFGAPWHCCPPAGAEPPFAVGSSRTPLAPKPVAGPARAPDAVPGPDTAPTRGAVPAAPSWGAAWAATAVRPILERCTATGRLRREEAAVVERAADRMAAGDFDAPQPALVDGVARIHGDLWSGNVLWSAVDTGAVLIDPHAQGGHAETDLAMLALFGLPQLERLLAAYDEASPLAEGWRDRIAMQQLQPLLVHTMLFGGGYAAHAVAVARSLA